jgi:hypothetical protein
LTAAKLLGEIMGAAKAGRVRGQGGRGSTPPRCMK